MPRIEETLQAILDETAGEIRVAAFGIVTRWYPGSPSDPESPAVDVRPVTNEPLRTVDGERIFQQLPVIPKVPVMFPQSGARFSITWEMAPGDTVLLVIPAREWSHWFVTGQPAPAYDDRPHSLGNAVAFPCGFARGGGPLTATNSLVHQGAIIRMGDSTANLSVALASLVKTEIDKVITGFNSHTHPYVNGTTPAVTSAPTPAQVLAPSLDTGSSVLKTKL